MTDQTKIEWTDFTVNFWEGCQKVGPGCDNCYAEARDVRFTGGTHWGPGAPRRKVQGGIAKLRKINRGAEAFHNETGRWPRVFCSSLSDVFDNAIDPDWRTEAFSAIKTAPRVRIQLLTKRVGNVEKMIPATWCDDWPHWVGLMITTVDQAEADRDIPKLLDLKARLGIPWVGISIEPMLGPIDLTNLQPALFEAKANALTGLWKWADGPTRAETHVIDWVICGGESGPSARPMHPQWVQDLRDQCQVAGTPFFFKQWGEWKPISHMQEFEFTGLYRSNRKAREHEDQEIIDDLYGQTCTVPTLCLQLDGAHQDPLEIAAWGHGAMLAFRTGKKRAGRLLNGREWNGAPS